MSGGPREVVKLRVVLPPLVVRKRVASPCTSQHLMNSVTACFTLSLVVAILAGKGDIPELESMARSGKRPPHLPFFF